MIQRNFEGLLPTPETADAGLWKVFVLIKNKKRSASCRITRRASKKPDVMPPGVGNGLGERLLLFY